MANAPAKQRNTRVASQSQSQSASAPAKSFFAKANNKRTYYKKKLLDQATAIENDATFQTWSKGMLEERLKLYQENYLAFDAQCLNMVCEDPDDDSFDMLELDRENQVIEENYISVKAKIRDRLDGLEQAKASEKTKQETVRVELQPTDALGNIPNTWGNFDGDYSKWKCFRDRFKHAVHDNEHVKPIFKFQYLKTACTKEAKGVLGEWELTDENYAKAWARLQTIYEDDYMQVQSFMRKLYGIPRMQRATSKLIRELIDTIHQCVHGLLSYIPIGNIDPFVVFLAIDRMDNDLYRAWEKCRLSLEKKHNTDSQQNQGTAETEGAASIAAQTASNDQRSYGKHIPTWKELEDFLEGEVSIQVHNEQRNESATQKNRILKPNEANKQNITRTIYNKQAPPEYMQCKLCDSIHPLHKCEVFKGMSLNGRKDYVIANNLCYRCMRKEHGSSECNSMHKCEPCRRCPSRKFHNSLLCPTKEAEVQTALLNTDTSRGAIPKQLRPL